MQDIQNKVVRHSTTAINRVIQKNRVEKWQSLAMVVFELIRMVNSCLLVIVIPQNCGDGRNCTFKENFEDLNRENIAAVVFNFVVFACYWVAYGFAKHRDNFLIDTLEDDPTVSRDNIDQVYQQFHKQIYLPIIEYNRRLFWTAITLAILYLVNTVLSTYVIIDFFIGYTVIFQILLNVLISVAIIYRFVQVSTEKYPTSAFITVQQTYNAVDPAFLRRMQIERAVVEMGTV